MRIDNLEDVIISILAAHPTLRVSSHTRLYGRSPMAQMYGRGAKHDTMEWKFRAWRREAQKLRATGGESTFQQQPTGRKKTRKASAATKGLSSSGKPSKSRREKLRADSDKEEYVPSTASLDFESDTSENDSLLNEPTVNNERITRRTRTRKMAIKFQSVTDSDIDDEIFLLGTYPCKKVRFTPNAKQEGECEMAPISRFSKYKSPPPVTESATTDTDSHGTASMCDASANNSDGDSDSDIDSDSDGDSDDVSGTDYGISGSSRAIKKRSTNAAVDADAHSGDNSSFFWHGPYWRSINDL
ncbi:hypothetical protein N7539_002155 [Penicillium diatomitis]|uniref:Uncharacterized protein n=1 Tax=Penicillium diatomitis TaxID=2819901 RepID=A0A9W9XIA2_9EURO|nr:uncharacterized protein N7539_002155 [Penicillium diatomitis]KAJ5493409.1 hypothetical protein N7539_002155 [Penicillium diatomitis]